MTPRELIEMLGRWDPDREFDISLLNNPFGGTDKQVILVQGNNAINLMPGPPKAEMVEVRTLDVGDRFGWNNGVWKVRTRGTTYVEAQDEQFSTFQMFQEHPAYGDPSWFTEIRLIGESEAENKPWTPRELIESLSKWHPDQPIEVGLDPVSLTHTAVLLVQNNNSILLTKGRA